MANIYTDSRYAFGVTHDCGMLWKQRRFLTSGQKIKNSSYIFKLLEAIQLPRLLAIIKIPGHAMAKLEESRGNDLADTAVNLAAL